MLTLTFTEAVLRRHATTQSFDRGEAYAKSGAVASLTLRGQVLQAEVEGSDVQPYRVTAQFDQGGITTADCTCEYSFEGWCKHIVAMLLVSLRQSNTIEPRPTLAQLLDRLNPLQTQQLLQTLVDHHPELIDEIDRHINSTPTSKPASSEAKAVRRTEIDPAPVRRRVRQIIRDGIRDLEDGSEEDPITEDLEEVIQDAQAFSESGDGNSAIVILAAITQACAEDWSDLEDYGADSDATVAALNEAWTEAILSAELTPEQVVDLQIELESQQDSLGSFEMSLVALRQGWTYPPLLRVLAGEISELGSWEGDAPDYSDDLALIRLRILDRQARYDEYLHLAEAKGQTQCYLTMLAQLGRITEAVSAAQTNMSMMEEAFALAKTLRDQNAVPEALEIAQAGLSLPGHCGYDFATWTSDLAQGLGHPDLALRAGTIAFNLRPSFANYRQVEALAGSTWTTHKIELLARLRASQSWDATQAKVDIFLHEGLIEDAISVVSDQSSYQSELIQRVMDAAMPSHSSWVIENARRRAESIMDAKKAEHYGHAIEWLKKARTAYLHLENRTEWVTYRTQLMQTHARKYKLMGLLKHRDLE